MKQNWTYKKLGEICDFINGFAFKSEKFRKEGLPILRISNIQNDVVVEDEMVYFSPSDYKDNFTPYEVLPGDIVIAMSGATTGKIGINIGNKKYYLNQRVGKFVIKDFSISKRFLYYYLKTISLKILNDAIGVAQPNISSTQIKNYSIPVPPLSTQSRIVSELDLLQSLIDKQKAQLKEYDTLAQSIFYDMFGDPVENEKGWEVKNLSAICSKITDGTHDTPQRLDKGIKFITGKHIRPYCIDYDNSDYVTEEVHKEIFMRCNPEFGDVLYTNIGAGIGNAAINIVDYEFSMKNVALLKLQKDNANGYFIEYYLNNEKIKTNIIENFSNGGAQKFFSLKSIAKIPIVLPPHSLQQTFATKIELIDKQKSAISKSIAETEKLFEYTMDKYFG